MSLADNVRQISILLSLPSLIVMGMAAAAIIIVRDWRIVLFAFALLSVVLSLLLSQAIPTEWALLQAIVGGLIAVMLFLSARQLRWTHTRGSDREGRWPQLASLSSFRLLAVMLAAAGFLVIHETIQFPVVSTLYRDAILWLGLMGIMGLALHEEPLHAGLALLMTIEASSMLLYQLNQQHTLVGLMEGWQLLLGLAISYLTLARGLAAETGPEQRTLWWRP
jgi:hypothetical protein